MDTTEPSLTRGLAVVGLTDEAAGWTVSKCRSRRVTA